MSLIGDASATVLTKAALPWALAAGVFVVAAAGTSGAYFGALVERGRHAAEIANLKEEQLRSVNLTLDLWKQAVKNGDKVSTDFADALKGLRIENKTFVNEVKTEVQREVYTDCRLPDSGIDLLSRQVNAANMRLIGKTPAAAGAK